MKKVKLHNLRLWLSVLLCCLAGSIKAYDVKIQDLNPIFQVGGYPLYVVEASPITVSSGKGTFNYVYIDDNCIVRNISSVWSKYTVDVSLYLDGKTHKLQIKSANIDYGTCYFTSDTPVAIDGIYYYISDNQAYVVDANKNITRAEILAEYEYKWRKYPVTTISSYAFDGCSELTSISIPNSVTSIGDYAFSGCSALKELTMEDGTETLSLGYNGSSKGLFYNCPIEKLYLGRNLWYGTTSGCGYSPFYGKRTITDLTISESVTSIYDYAFYGCSALTSISIPNSVTTIGDNALRGCSALKKLTFEDGTETLSLGYNSQYNFSDCPIEKIYLGRNLSYVSISSDHSPFYGKTTITDLTISKSVTSIGDYAFSGCSGLTSVSIPNSVTSIGNYAFNMCSGLKELTLEDGTETLSLGFNEYSSSSNSSGQGMFYDCPIEKLYLGRNLLYNSSYGYSPFYNKIKLADLTIGENVTALGMSCFSGCSAIKQFHSQSYNIEGLDKSGLTSENVLAIITPDELNQETIDKISQSNLTYFKNLLIENGGKTYSVITAPNYINISGCVINNATTQLVAYDNTAIAISSSGSIGNAYFRGVDVRDRITFGGVSFKPSSLWEENIFDISEKSGVVGITIDDGTEQEVEVYDLKGSLVYKGLRSEVRLQRGIYIVRQGSKVAKIHIN